MMETDNGKQYSLRWEKHALNLASEAGGFFEDESFLDCTLSAEGQCIEAHKIILSAASTYLSNLLKIMPDRHPIIIFNDIKFEQLKSLVAFIYSGSVNVSENNIHAFLNAAQSLLIKGLSEESKDEDKTTENNKRLKNIETQEFKANMKKHKSNHLTPKRIDLAMDSGKSLKKQAQDGSSNMKCEESLSKFHEISITKYLQQNLSSKLTIRNESVESKWNGSVEDKVKGPENYVVKSWKHNSVEDLNGRIKLGKNNSVKKIRLEKPKNFRSEESELESKKSNYTNVNNTLSGNHTEQNKPVESEEKIKKTESEQSMIVEPKQEIIEEEEDTNSEEYNSQGLSNDTIPHDSESLYESRAAHNYHQPVVDRGIPVPLLMCRTSLSELDSDPNWVPPAAGNFTSDYPRSLLNSVDTNAQDLQCRTCSQDLPCPTCRKKYKSRYALNRHILYECGEARKSFSCDECGKKVTRQDTLQKHKLIHLVQHLKKKEESSKQKKIC